MQRVLPHLALSQEGKKCCSRSSRGHFADRRRLAVQARRAAAHSHTSALLLHSCCWPELGATQNDGTHVRLNFRSCQHASPVILHKCQHPEHATLHDCMPAKSAEGIPAATGELLEVGDPSLGSGGGAHTTASGDAAPTSADTTARVETGFALFLLVADLEDYGREEWGGWEKKQAQLGSLYSTA